MRYFIFLLLVAAVAVYACGCGNDTVVVRPGASTLAEVDIDPGDDSFSITVPWAMMGGKVVGGPFLIEGENIEYNPGIGALMVDLTVTNTSPHSYPLPAHVEFVILAPEGVQILNPDNGVFGEGAQIELHFTNRDLVWSPGESSQPRSVQFGVDDGVSIGFGVRIRVGPDESLGSIHGMVFFDADEDGEHDPGEGGIAGREIHVAWTDSLFDCIPELDCPIIRSTTTDIAGEYRFDDLRAGFYTVIIVRDRCSYHTTPTELQVILVSKNGEVSDFFHADFGVIPVRECP